MTSAFLDGGSLGVAHSGATIDYRDHRAVRLGGLPRQGGQLPELGFPAGKVLRGGRQMPRRYQASRHAIGPSRIVSDRNSTVVDEQGAPPASWLVAKGSRIEESGPCGIRQVKCVSQQPRRAKVGLTRPVALKLTDRSHAQARPGRKIFLRQA